MSGSRFHPYALEEGTDKDRSRKASGKSATASTSHQATSSIKMLAQSTSSTIKRNKLPNRKPKPVPRNKAAPTGVDQAVFRSIVAASKSTSSTAEDSRSAPISVIASKSATTPVSSGAAVASKSAPTTPVSSRAPTAVASRSASSTAVASRSAPSTTVASRTTPTTPAASVPLTLRRGPSTLEPTSTPLPGNPVSSGLAAYPYWSMAQSSYATEHQRRIQLQQQMWMQQPNLEYMTSANHEYQRSISQEYLRGTSQEFLRGTSQENLRGTSQESLCGTSFGDYLSGTSQEYLRGTSQENLRDTSQESLCGTSYEEYLRYMNELRHMSVVPLVPTPAVHLSYFSPMQDQPLNLSLKDDSKDLTHDSQSSSFSSNKPIDLVDCFSPEKPKCFQEPKPSSLPSLKLHPTKPIQKGSLDPEVAKMFPHLRTTDMGSIVLWNFLWALLADNNYKGIIRWIDRPSLQFEVVHPLALAKLWGTVKKNKTMNWQKLMKVINLYLSKNIVKQGEDKLKFQFILVPQSPEVKTEKDSSA